MSQENANNKPLIRWVNRRQMSWRAVDVERLVGEDHLVRSIWTLIGRMDLGQFYESIESSAEEGGRQRQKVSSPLADWMKPSAPSSE